MLDKVLRERTVHNVLFYLIALFFIFFLSWAYVAEIDQVVRAEALVEPVGKVQQVQSRYPGAVAEMNISVGDVVKAGDVLITLDTQEAQSTFEMANQKSALLRKEQSIYTPLVNAGIEPEIKLVQIEQRLLEATDQLQRAELQLKFSRLIAPIDGVLTAVNLTGPGAVIRAGDILAEVVPHEEYYLIKAKILPKDIGKVTVGQNARVSYTAYDFSRYGIMEGEVTKIAQNTTKTQQGEIYYDAWIKTKGSTFSKSPINPNILPGMIAQVDMLGEKRTIFEYIMSPLNRMASRA
ncbi:MAG TPA: HlyD family efflux transporter periplasmic adaptor subunit, partial [Piscirickettsiaceae bacterium]|nr:HlyD family efflux transporter periplasmic adaptor subunit [Piscirickettsiaceae bacterium]